MDTTTDPRRLLLEVLLSSKGKQDPGPRFDAIREHSPLFCFTRGESTIAVVARYDECNAVLRDPRFGKLAPDAPWERVPVLRGARSRGT
jgi:hypothetical protein